MSIEAIGAVLRRSNAEHAARLVLLALANHANDDDTAWPSVKTICRLAKLSERSARQCLRKLEAGGEIKAVGKAKFGTTIYLILPGGQSVQGAFYAGEGGHSMQGGGAQIAPKPSVGEPLTQPSIPSGGEHQAFIEQWHDAYQMQFRRPYVMAGGKDGAAVKRLLAASKMNAGALMKIAIQAWAKKGKGFWACQKAVDISSFCSRFNEIQAELSREPSKAGYADPDVFDPSTHHDYFKG